MMHSIILIPIFFMLCLHGVYSFSGFRVKYASMRGHFKSCTANFLGARRQVSDGLASEQQDFVVGENIPDEILKMRALYDMVLVERFNAPDKTPMGLFLPKIEGKDRKHLGYVLSVPQGHGLESENGLVQPIEKIAPFKRGDTVFIKDPWGIGPMNIELGTRFFSFHKAEHITGVVRSSEHL